MGGGGEASCRIVVAIFVSRKLYREACRTAERKVKLIEGGVDGILEFGS